MYREYLKHLISFIVAPTEELSIASPLAFDGLHDDIKLFVVRCLYWKLNCSSKVNANQLL